MRNRVVLIRPDFSTTEMHLSDNPSDQLKQMQEAVGGYLQQVFLPKTDQYMLVDEEGLLKELEPNMKASLMAQKLIVGNALLCDADSLEDDDDTD